MISFLFLCETHLRMDAIASRPLLHNVWEESEIRILRKMDRHLMSVFRCAEYAVQHMSIDAGDDSKRGAGDKNTTGC